MGNTPWNLEIMGRTPWNLEIVGRIPLALEDHMENSLGFSTLEAGALKYKKTPDKLNEGEKKRIFKFINTFE